MRRLMFILWRLGRADLRKVWFALKHPDRPVWLIPAVALLTLYAISPFNLFIPVIGLLDDLVLVPLALHFLVKLLPPHLQQGK
jgi:uncharacterized membrane protein YkvA (DUF1232 family)